MTESEVFHRLSTKGELKLRISNLAEKFRAKHPLLPETKPGDPHGWFQIPSQYCKGAMNVVMSAGEDWEHVSVSLGADSTETPTWRQMCFVKDLFWSPEETVVQFHPKESQYVNNHPGCLHLWKRTGVDHELPPRIFVGI